MLKNHNRRNFLKLTTLTAAGIGVENLFPKVSAGYALKRGGLTNNDQAPSPTFTPDRVASWWTTLEDLQWPQKKIIDNIKKRAAGFAKAGIDTAINFGFHIRFDFSNYFGQLHGYYNNVCGELHQNNIKFIEHYSCNHIARPKDESELKKMNKFQRHHVLLYHDAIAAKYAQYEGHFFNDICEIDIRDGSKGYAPQYQLNTFCHNNPAFLDMHQKYLTRLMKEVSFDGIMVDDMCNYAALTTCGCIHCRERFKHDYGNDIPPFGEPSFWGDTSRKVLEWGNYENPVFKNWLTMKTDCIADHLRMIKNTIGAKPLMTCCSNTGPVVLNALSLDLEKMAPLLDFFVLENVGTNVKNINWMEMDAEALHQKDIAQQTGNAPAMALSYTIYEKGAYFGWALSRFWGVSNWSSTLNYRLEEDPADAMEMEDVISSTNNWEITNSRLNYREGKDLAEVRLVNNSYCKQNGWKDTNGREHWDRVKAWSKQLVENNMGYRFVRSAELGNKDELMKEHTPLILDGVACISDKQYEAILYYLSNGGIAWIAFPFGTHNEKGLVRKVPLSTELLKNKYTNLLLTASAVSGNALQKLIATGKCTPVLKQVKGDKGWVARIRFYNEKPVIHFMNTALLAVPHATLKDLSDIPILVDIDTLNSGNNLIYEIDSSKVNIEGLLVMSPELKEVKRRVDIVAATKKFLTIQVNLEGVKIYAVAGS